MFARRLGRVCLIVAAAAMALSVLGCESTGLSRTEVTVGAFDGAEPPAGTAVRYNSGTGQWEAATSDLRTFYYDPGRREWRQTFEPRDSEFRPITPARSEEARRLENLKPVSPEDSLLLHGAQ